MRSRLIFTDLSISLIPAVLVLTAFVLFLTCCNYDTQQPIAAEQFQFRGHTIRLLAGSGLGGPIEIWEIDGSQYVVAYGKAICPKVKQ